MEKIANRFLLFLGSKRLHFTDGFSFRGMSQTQLVIPIISADRCRNGLR